MKLYHMHGACSLADLIVLEWSGAPYQLVRVSLQDLKQPEYLALNPNGAVPLLEDGEFRLTENVAILGYLADSYPALALLGDGSPRGRADAMRWLGFLSSDVHKAFKPLFSPARFLPDPALAPELGEVARSHVREYFERLNQRLVGRDWLTGQRSVADPYLFVLTRWALGKQVDLHGLDEISRFAARMNEDPGVRAALAVEATS